MIKHDIVELYSKRPGRKGNPLTREIIFCSISFFVRDGILSVADYNSSLMGVVVVVVVVVVAIFTIKLNGINGIT